MSQFQRVAQRRGKPISLTVDGHPITAMQGNSVLAAMLLSSHFVRRLEFGGEMRAGFCLMGACQDCWVWTADGSRLRACSTLVEERMALLTEPPSTPVLVDRNA